jgi:hypothetical protein
MVALKVVTMASKTIGMKGNMMAASKVVSSEVQKADKMDSTVAVMLDWRLE